MNVPTVTAGMTRADLPIQTTSVEKFSEYIRMQMAPTAYRTEICSLKEHLKRDPKFISWVIAIPGALPSIRKQDGCIGEKWGPMRTKIQGQPEWAWMNLIRPGDPVILDGPILLEKM